MSKPRKTTEKRFIAGSEPEPCGLPPEEAHRTCWQAMSALLNTYGVRRTLDTFGRLLYFEHIQGTEIEDIPAIDRAIMQIANEHKIWSADEIAEDAAWNAIINKALSQSEDP